MIIDESMICQLCLYDNTAPDAEPCVKCTDLNLKFEWGGFPLTLEEETEEDV